MEEVILTLLFKYDQQNHYVQYTEWYWAHEEIVSRESNDTQYKTEPGVGIDTEN